MIKIAGNEAGKNPMKTETRLCGHEMCGGCRLFALNKQEAVRCFQQTGMGWLIGV